MVAVEPVELAAAARPLAAGDHAVAVAIDRAQRIDARVGVRLPSRRRCCGPRGRRGSPSPFRSRLLNGCSLPLPLRARDAPVTVAVHALETRVHRAALAAVDLVAVVALVAVVPLVAVGAVLVQPVVVAVAGVVAVTVVIRLAVAIVLGVRGSGAEGDQCRRRE